MKNFIKKIFSSQESYERHWKENLEKRWGSMSILSLKELGFSFPKVYFDTLISSENHQLKNCENSKINLLFLKPLDEENYVETTQLNGFKSMTIGEYQHGESAIIIPDDKEILYFMDDLGEGTQICEKTTLDQFFTNHI